MQLLRRVFSTYAPSIRAIDYFRIVLMVRIEIHQPSCDCELRVHSAGSLGSCRHIFSIQSAERWACVLSLWQYYFWSWLNSHRDFPRRNGLYVSPSYGIAIYKKCTSSYDTGILWWEHNIDGLQRLRRPTQNSGVSSKVRARSAGLLLSTINILHLGWMTIFAWITVTAASPAYLSNIVIGLVVFNYPDYTPERWHGTFIMWGFVVIPVVWNFWFRKMLNTLEMIGGICHVIFFIVSIITLVCLAQRSDASYVFNTLTTGVSGWTNPGVAFSLGMLTVTFPITSFDGVLHMSQSLVRKES